ncbi:MAG: membrane protein insertase YidC [Muribaculum sp.]|nr:membrane protein insertase YidC [Muribaculaceae bacterium]MCM1081120.1 membrane protein insertase YidC [Muribaculum sp.]
MDKNTITGLLLIGLIMIGFMWLNQPDPNANSPMPAAEITENQADAIEADNLAPTADTLSLTDLQKLAREVAAYGTPDSVAPFVRLTNERVNLLSDGNAVSGTVNVAPGKSVELSQLIGDEARKLPPVVADSALRAVKATMLELVQFKGFARYLNGKADTIRLQNKYLKLDLSTRGAMISRIELNDYKSFRGGNVLIANGDNNEYSFILTSSNREFDTRDFYFTPTQVNDSTVVMSLNLGGESQLNFRYTLPADSYIARLDIEQKGMENIIPSSTATMDFIWRQKMLRQEEGRVFEERNSAIYYKYAGGDTKYLSETSNDQKEVDERLKWIGFKNQFFSMAFIANTTFNRADLVSEVLPRSNDNYIKRMEAVSTFDYSPSNPQPASFNILMTPNLYPLLSEIDSKLYPDDDLELTRFIPLGWALFRWINTWIVIPVFTFLGSWFTNYGIIILLLTIFIKILIFPFTYKSYMSQAKMRLLSPEIKAINDKYPGQENAMTRQQKTMALYSQAGANPMAGCLPMLLQMPVLIAMFAFFPSCIELRGEHFLWAKDLSAPDAIISWTTNIPLVSEYFGNHISLFCLLMTITNIVYTRITMASQPGGQTMPGMKAMQYMFPFMFLIFFNNYAAGLSYYYFLSLLITIIQTYVFRHVVNEEKMRAKMAENAKKPRKKSSFMARLEEAQRQQQAMLREQQKRNGRR